MPVPIMHSTGSRWAEAVAPLAHTEHTLIRFFDVPEIIREIEPQRALQAARTSGADLSSVPVTGGSSLLTGALTWPNAVSAPHSEPVPFAHACVVDLTRWLGVSKRDLLRRLGISPSTFYSWSERGSDPRPGTTRQLFKVHSLALLIVDTFEEKGARSWFHAGDPSNRERFLEAAGNRPALELLAEDVRRVVVPRSTPLVVPSLAARAGDEDTVMPDAVLEGW